MANSLWRTCLCAAFIVTATSGLSSYATDTPATLPTTNGAVFHINNMTLEQTMNYLHRLTGVNIVVNWHALAEAGVSKDTTINLDLEHVRFRKALQLILDQASPEKPLTWTVDENVLEITSQAQADKQMVTRIYQVRDLVMTAPTTGNIKPPAMGISTQTLSTGSSGGSGYGTTSNNTLFQTDSTTTTTSPTATADAKGKELVTMITTVIRPNIWVENGGEASIKYFSGRLIVTAPQSVQEAIGGQSGIKVGN